MAAIRLATRLVQRQLVAQPARGPFTGSASGGVRGIVLTGGPAGVYGATSLAGWELSRRLFSSNQARLASTPAPPPPPPSSSSSNPASTPNAASTPTPPTASSSPAPTISSPPRKASPVSSIASDLLADIPDPSQDSSSSSSQSGTGGSGEPPRRRRNLSTIQKRRQTSMRIALAAVAVGGVVGLFNAGREWESEEEKIKLTQGWEEGVKEEGFEGWRNRAGARIWDALSYFSKPAWETLLPPPNPPPYQQPYTLILDLDGLMTSSVWTVDRGWRTAKRPGLDYFLSYLSQFYEIVLFTPQHGYTADGILVKLDPYGRYIPYRLYREAMRYTNGHSVKDLSYLGRDLSKTIIIDTKSEHVELQPENAIILPRWEGNRKDDGLVRLIPLLEAIAFRDVQDVRPILTSYRGKDVAAEYAKKEAAEKEEITRVWKEKQDKRDSYGGAGRFLRSVIGVDTFQKDTQTPKTWIEKQREHWQKIYQEDQKQWKENEATVIQMMKEDEEKRSLEMKGSISEFLFGKPEQQPLVTPGQPMAPGGGSPLPPGTPVPELPAGDYGRTGENKSR